MFFVVSVHLIADKLCLLNISLSYIDVTKRRLALLGAGALATGLLKKSSAFAEGMTIFSWPEAVFSVFVCMIFSSSEAALSGSLISY